ncbi:hypothetical protein HanPI659440_Chr05g0202061 [Helianthus annuus]|nr:hypothetical protein HanPI659440_Chr05g0202061 [Helianthus annuus]
MSKEVEYNQLADVATISNKCHTPKIHARSTTAWRRDMTRIKPPIILNNINNKSNSTKQHEMRSKHKYSFNV